MSIQTSHPDKDLVLQNECQVEFAYVWPVDTDNNRRWLSGLFPRSYLQSSNLHNHRFNEQSKVVHDNHNALEKDKSLITHDITTGWLLVVIQFILIFYRTRNALYSRSSIIGCNQQRKGSKH